MSEPREPIDVLRDVVTKIEQQSSCASEAGACYLDHAGCSVNESLTIARAGLSELEKRAEDLEIACAWSDYRKDYGVGSDPMKAAHKAFKAGWQAAREGDQSGVQR